MTPNEDYITNVIRESILNNTDREGQFGEIMNTLGCTRQCAKQLYYAFLWQAKESYLLTKFMEFNNVE